MTDPTPWDLAMEAIEDRGCDCDGDPEDIADHTCIAGRCEHALLTERAARDDARRERDAARIRADNFNDLIGRCWGALQVEPVGGIVDAIAALRSERDAAAAHVAICPDCGEVETCDEDRCCESCGRDLLVFADRYSAELYQEGQQSHADAIATLRMRVAEVNEVLCSDADDRALRAVVAGLCSFARGHGDDR